VDFVSQEAALAGKFAVKYVSGLSKDGSSVAVEPQNGVRYTVPSRIHPENAEDNTVIRFRTDNVYRDVFLSVYLDEERVMHLKKRILTPGEMEQVTIPKKWMTDRPGLARIRILVEKE
jgi:sarcosine oxidase subunit alpha